MIINIYDLISPAFYDLLEDVLDEKYTHFWLYGGRSSLKSSFISIVIALKMMLDHALGIESHCVVLRKVGETLANSVFEQMLWAIEMLGVSDLWEVRKSPLQLIYRPSGQRILFWSSFNKEDYKKIKSAKFKTGYCKYVWFEELDEFFGMSEIRNITISLLRGGTSYEVFYSYNPPKLLSSWVNAEVLNQRPDRIVHKSTYLQAPREWVGEQVFIEAEELKKTNELAYRNEFLGEPTGTGGNVFANVIVREITQEERNKFDNILDGLDFGYASDPNAYIQCHFDSTRRKLYIFNEIYKVEMTNRPLVDEIRRIKVGNSYITCDSAEPKSIAELNNLGLRARGAKKGPDSIEYGIKFLQSLNEIVIDIYDCPNASREFSLYELDEDRFGGFKAKFPDKNNHTIDAVRYAIEDYTIQNNWQFSNRKLL